MSNTSKAAEVFNALTSCEQSNFRKLVELEQAGFDNAREAQELLIKLCCVLAQLMQDTRK